MATMKIGTEEVLKIMYGTEEVSSLAIGEETIPVSGGDDYSKMPFTVEALSDGNLALRNYGKVARVYNYSINGGASNSFEFTTGSVVSLTIPLKTGDVVEFTVASDQNGTSDSSSKYVAFTPSTCEHKIYGNINSLSYVNWKNVNTTPSGCYKCLFQNDTKLSDAEGLFLSFDELTASCYFALFNGCSILTKAPSLNTLSLPQSCYSSMFQKCTSLVIPPSLPASAVSEESYSHMFDGCSSLLTIPEIMATTLDGSRQFGYMFNKCVGLTSVEIPFNPSATYACNYMFYGCSNLSYVKCLASSFGQSATNGWMADVSPTGTFVKKAGVSWTTGASGIPDGWTVEEVD